MVRLVKGSVVVIPFPFSDLSSAKRRPALAVAVLPGDDVILCQITSQQVADRFAVHITQGDFATGGLRRDSNVRPNRLFTADSKLILYQAGILTAAKVNEIIAGIVQIIST